MKAKFFDREDESNPLNGQVFDSDNRFAEVLDHNRLRTPFYSELEGENGQNLLVGIAYPTSEPILLDFRWGCRLGA